MIIHINLLNKRYLLPFLFVFCLAKSTLFSQIPDNYYENAYGKSGYELKVSLSHIIYEHTILIYGGDYEGGLWDAFRCTDTRPDGTVWDIYSDCTFIPWEDGHISGSGECMGGTQQEHTFCQSWMNYCETPLYSDMFHMYPVDAWVNGRRSNYPYGEVPDDEDWVTRYFNNGARAGYNAFVGKNMTSTCGIAYEPADQYKGDIARGFLYIATCYMFTDDDFSEDYEMTSRSQLRPWAQDMMMKWHHQDGVSQKEIDRNNKIYSQFQHNRNPYIDYPELADLVFGKDSANAVFYPTMARAPQNLCVTPDSMGRRRAMLTWTNPTHSINGEEPVLTAIVIQRNGVTIHTILHPIAGESMAWMDQNVPANREYEYRVFATTNEGNGLMASQTVYVGKYCPVIAELFDTQYDGWGGDARIEFQDSVGQMLAFSKLPCGEGWENLYEYRLPPEKIYCFWTPGTADEENSFRLYDDQLDVLFEATSSDIQGFNGTFFIFNNNCPLTECDTIYYYDEVAICENALPFEYGDTVFEVGTPMNSTYQCHFVTESGIDSVVILQLTIHTLPIIRIISEVDPWNQQNTILTATGALRYVWNTGDTTSTIRVSSFDDTTMYYVIGTDENDCSNVDSIVINVGTAVSDNSLESTLAIYPNPVSTNLYIIPKEKTKIQSAEIFDSIGRKLMSVRLIEDVISIDVTKLSTGFYFIQLKVNDDIVTTRFIKK